MERKAPYRSNANRRTSGVPDTAAELIQYKGRKADYRATRDLWIEVEILDTRYTWGQVHYLITPVAGSGSQWVASGIRLRD